MISNFKSLLHEWFIMPKQQKNQPYSTVDPRIADLVEAFNAIEGVTTVASCQGHCCGRDHHPYVYFSAPIEFAAWLSEQCRESRKDKRYYTPWEVEGVFNGENELMFSLLSPLYRQHCLYSLYSGWWYLGWHRERVDGELDYLKEIVMNFQHVTHEQKSNKVSHHE